MTGAEILSRANYLLDDEIDDVEALALINLGINDMSIDSPFEDTAALSLADGVRYVTVPSDCVELVEVRISGNKLRALDSPLSPDLTAEGTPSEYYLLGDNINLYPLADAAYTVDILFNSGYSSITNLSSTPEIPSNFHMGLVYWLASHFKTYDDEPNASENFLDKYYTYKGALKHYQQSRSEYSITREE